MDVSHSCEHFLSYYCVTGCSNLIGQGRNRSGIDDNESSSDSLNCVSIIRVHIFIHS